LVQLIFGTICIRMVNLAGIDLNLIKVLHALLEERTVTAAGRRIGLSQPATSNALRRLRVIVSDPLFVRGPSGLVPTAFAEDLRLPVRKAILALEEAFQPPRPFHPATAQGTVSLAASDSIALVVLPRLWRLLATEAPGINLHVRSGERPQIEAMLRDGEVDLALGPFGSPRGGWAAEPIYEEGFSLVVRPDHPLLDGPMTPERMVSYPAVLVAPGGGRRGIVDAALAELGLERRVAVVVSHFLLAPHLLRDSDLVLVLATRVTDLAARPLGLAVRPPPLTLGRYHAVVAWPVRNASDPRVTWMRALIRRAASDLETSTELS
jgi:DNA-binding transcriptional LysR family regulator